VTWINTDELPEPTQPHPETITQLIAPPLPTPQPTELKQVPTEPQQEPPPPPENFIVFRDRGKFRNNRI